MPAPPDRDPRLDHFLCFAIYSANLAFNRIYRPLLDRLGLTYVQYLVLVALWDQDDQIVGALCTILFLRSNTLTPVLKRLEQMGYVRRSRDLADERQVRVQLTEEGRALEQATADVPHCITIAAGLSPAETGQIMQMVSALRDRLLADAPADVAVIAEPRDNARSRALVEGRERRRRKTGSVAG